MVLDSEKDQFDAVMTAVRSPPNFTVTRSLSRCSETASMSSVSSPGGARQFLMASRSGLAARAALASACKLTSMTEDPSQQHLGILVLRNHPSNCAAGRVAKTSLHAYKLKKEYPF